VSDRRTRSRRERSRQLVLKSEDEIGRMRRAGKIVALVLDRLARAAVPGVTTGELNRLAETLIGSFGAVPTFYGFQGYPASTCVSVNDEVVHGIPGDRVLGAGDIVSFDVGATIEGMIADSAMTVGVDRVTEGADQLMRVTREALDRGIEQAVPGNRVADISAAVQDYAEAHGYSVVRKLVGHGVGRSMWEPPQVPNFVEGGRDGSPELVPGMTLAIEPMVNEGEAQVVQDADGWTYRTKDRSLSAHFEHTVAVTESGCEILTLRVGPTPRAAGAAPEGRAGRHPGAAAGGQGRES
jgi:methionyl aminopeptidase